MTDETIKSIFEDVPEKDWEGVIEQLAARFLKFA